MVNAYGIPVISWPSLEDAWSLDGFREPKVSMAVRELSRIKVGEFSAQGQGRLRDRAKPV